MKSDKHYYIIFFHESKSYNERKCKIKIYAVFQKVFSHTTHTHVSYLQSKIKKLQEEKVLD